MSDVDAVLVDSLKALDPNRPIREADMRKPAVSGIVSANWIIFLVLILLPSRRRRNDVNNYWNVVAGREVVICRAISRCLSAGGVVFSPKNVG